MLHLTPAVARFLQAIADRPDDAYIERAGRGKLRVSGTDVVVTRASPETLQVNDLVTGTNPEHATLAGRQWLPAQDRTTPLHSGLRDVLTSGQAAVRGAEQRATPQSVHAVYESLCQLPLLDMDDQAYAIVQGAVRLATTAKDAETWSLLLKVEDTVSAWLHQPDASLAADDALMAVARPGVHCSSQHELSVTLERAAWLRAYRTGVKAPRVTASASNGNTSNTELGKATVAFPDAVRRAIPYAALYGARRAGGDRPHLLLVTEVELLVS
ncbi:hypothetical protein [Streptomyces sp. NPDC047841]|uniref:hypothetical protein n=1 Tax=Streptomyces sp. NPDC047841 TaxID=3154708 RepID=UPI0034538DF7